MKGTLGLGRSRAMRNALAGLLLAILAPLPAFAGTTMYFVHNDHLGTPVAVTDPNQAVVWEANKKPFGETDVTSAIHEHARFPGQMFDEETGLSYNYFRDYDPSMGRYIQSDPVGLQGGLNTYVYVGGNPLIYADPYGLAPGWVGPTSVALELAGGALALHPNPATPPAVRIAGVALFIVGGGLQVWDAATAVDDVKDIVRDDVDDFNRSIEKINDLLNPPPDDCD